MLRLVVASLVKTRLGKAVKVLRGMSRLSEERLVKARLSKAAGVWHVEARCSMLRRNRGMAGRVKAVMSRFGFACCGVAVEASPDAARQGLVW